MKIVSNDFKTEITTAGRMLKNTITYDNTTLTDDDLYQMKYYRNGDILRTSMKQLEFETKESIPLNTILTCEVALKIDDEYETLNYGRYIVNSVEKREESGNYFYTCYDEMLLSMVDYEQLEITYPITIRNYINAICTKLGLTFKNTNDTFANYNKQILSELYLNSQGNSLGYTYRDVLDELAQVTASTICIDDNGELEIRYITNTNDSIDGDSLKNVNVSFKEKYGPVNSIVLSRSAESDNVYLQDTQSIQENGLCEIKIKDNQIMNFNDRADYLPDILDKLDGLEYYINDFSSTGILYYELCDKYTVNIDENSYECVIFNDEIDLSNGLEETIYTNIPELSETDYTKSDKTDKKINQTYLIVDKQNQIIKSVVNNVTEQNEKISQVTQTVDELNSKISDIADITISGESNYATFTLDNINESEPIMIKVRPITNNISYLYPRNNLYPSDTLYSTNRKIRFENLTTNEITDYTLPDDLLYYDSETYDEFYLDYDSQTCQVTKRCKYNADGTVGLLTNETTTSYTYPTITLTDGDYRLTLLGYEYGYLFVRLIASNIYTSQFATKSEVTSEINQKANEIDLSVNQKLSNYSTTTQMNSAIVLKANEITSNVNQTLTNYSTTSQMNSAINQKANEITSTVSQTYETKSNAQTQYSQIRQTTDAITSTVSTKVGKSEVVSSINQSSEAVTINANKINLNGVVTANSNFKILSDGSMEAKNGKFSGTIDGGKILINSNFTEQNPYLKINHPNSTEQAPILTTLWGDGISCINYQGTPNIRTENGNGYAELDGHVVNAFGFNNISLAEKKKDFELLQSGLDIIKNIDIYKYRYKNEETNKKHIGLVIGDDYKYSKEITTDDNKEVDLYSFIAVCCKAIQEQQEQIDLLKSEIKLLKERIDK